MKLTPSVAARTLSFLRRTIPRGHAEADDLLGLIAFYEQVLEQTQKKRHS